MFWPSGVLVPTQADSNPVRIEFDWVIAASAKLHEIAPLATLNMAAISWCSRMITAFAPPFELPAFAQAPGLVCRIEQRSDWLNVEPPIVSVLTGQRLSLPGGLQPAGPRVFQKPQVSVQLPPGQGAVLQNCAAERSLLLHTAGASWAKTWQTEEVAQARSAVLPLDPQPSAAAVTSVLPLMTIVLHRPEARFHVEPLCWQLPESEIAKPPPDGSGIVLPLAAYCAQVDQWMLIPPGAPDAPAQIWSVMLDGVEPMHVTVGASSLHFGDGPATAVAALRSVIPRRTVQANRKFFL